MKFTLVFPDGKGINQNTLVNKKKIASEQELCKLMKNHWCKWSGAKSFQDWADDLNADGNFECEQTADQAFDQLGSNYFLEWNGKSVSTHSFFETYGQEYMQ